MDTAHGNARRSGGSEKKERIGAPAMHKSLHVHRQEFGSRL